MILEIEKQFEREKMNEQDKEKKVRERSFSLPLNSPVKKYHSITSFPDLINKPFDGIKIS